MKKENENMRINKTSHPEDKKPQQQKQQEQKKIVPQNDSETAATHTGGSMSEGYLSNSRYSRERTRSLHDKQFVMGSDSDGQSN